jgi:transposase
MEAFLEESHIKLSGQVSDLFGTSGLRMLRGLAHGATNPSELAALAVPGLRASREQLADALHAATTLSPLRRQILRLFLERLELIDQQREVLAQSLAECLREHQEAVTRLAKTAGLGVDSAQQIIAEVGPRAASFDSAGQLASWVGCCPGREESAAVSHSDRSPKGSRAMRRILTQAAHAAIKANGSIFQDVYRRLVPRLGYQKAIWAVADKLCRVLWKILHDGVEYQERGNRPDPQTIQRRVDKLVRHLRGLGYQVQLSLVA